MSIGCHVCVHVSVMGVVFVFFVFFGGVGGGHGSLGGREQEVGEEMTISHQHVHQHTLATHTLILRGNPINETRKNTLPITKIVLT